MIHELKQELWVNTPKGRAHVLAWIDRGPHSDMEWICVQEHTGECWTVKNPDIRVVRNWTMGINKNNETPATAEFKVKGPGTISKETVDQLQEAWTK